MIGPDTQYGHGHSFFCDSCPAHLSDCPGGAGPCACVHTGDNYLKCWQGRPCEIVCIERYDWRRHIRHPRLRSLWSGHGYGPSAIDLPSVIPCGTFRMRLRAPALRWVALDARDVFELSSQHGALRPGFRDAHALRVTLGISHDTRVLLYLNASDPRLEGLYRMGDAALDAIAGLNVDLVGAPSFSVFAMRPRSDQVYNLRRMFTLFGEMEERGLPVFPNVFAGNEYDVAAWVRWLDDRPRTWLVGTVLQHQDNAFFDDFIHKLVRLQHTVSARPLPLHVVLYGVSSPHRARRARAIGLRHFACVSSNAAMVAGHGQRLRWNGASLLRAMDRSAPRHELLQWNVQAEADAFASLPVDGGLIAAPRPANAGHTGDDT